MTTGKGKRIPKPTRTDEVGILVDLYLPFLGAADQKAMLEAAVGIGQYFDSLSVVSKLDPSTGRWTQDDRTEQNIDLARNRWTTSDFSDMQETAGWLKRAIKQALHGQPATEEAQACARWLESNAGFVTLHVDHWGGHGAIMAGLGYPRGWSHKTDISGFIVEHWPKIIRSMGAYLTVEGFRNGAWAFIGACPRCGKVFSKKRSDELYDRKTCQVQATKGNATRLSVIVGKN